jgi:hypothetical protein
MQTLLSQFSESLSTLGQTNPTLLLGCSLVAPAAATFAVIFVARKLMAACWRGYWDVV